MSITIHPEYGGAPVLVKFEGTREDLTGGEYLGITARPELLECGDIITCVSTPSGDGYYYDPELLIEGASCVKVSELGGDAPVWQFLNRKAPGAPGR